MATNKVVYGDRTLIDLTSDSVTPSSLLEGETAHDRSGAQITGTLRSSGHTILNNQGQQVPARANLQFGKSVVTDDETNDITKVNVNNAIEKTYAEFQNMTPTERVDGSVYYIPDYPTLGNVFFFRTVDAMQAAIQHGDVPNNAICITTADYPYEAKAEDVIYDNTNSELESTNLQDAVDEIVEGLDSIADDLSDLSNAVDGKQDALTNPLTQSDVVNNLTSTATNVPLSAAQGKALNDNKQDKSQVYVDLTDDYNLDTLQTPGMYNCFCTISGVRSRYSIKVDVTLFGTVNLVQQIAYGVMGVVTPMFARYYRFNGISSDRVWTNWAPFCSVVEDVSSLVTMNSSGITNVYFKSASRSNNLVQITGRFEVDGSVRHYFIADSSIRSKIFVLDNFRKLSNSALGELYTLYFNINNDGWCYSDANLPAGIYDFDIIYITN